MACVCPGAVYPKRCMTVQHGQAVEAVVLAKPQPGGAMAVRP